MTTTNTSMNTSNLAGIMAPAITTVTVIETVPAAQTIPAANHICHKTTALPVTTSIAAAGVL